MHASTRIIFSLPILPLGRVCLDIIVFLFLRVFSSVDKKGTMEIQIGLLLYHLVEASCHLISVKAHVILIRHVSAL